MKEEVNNLEEEYEFLKEQYMQYEAETKDIIANLNHQLEIKIKSYEALEEQFKQQKVFY